MKIGTWILTISLAASAWAQSPAPKSQAASTPQATPKPQTVKQQSAAKPNASSPAKPAAAAAKSAAPAAKSAAPAAKSAQTAAAEKQASASSTAATKTGKAKPAHQTAKQAAGKQEPAKPEKDAKGSPGKTVAKATSVHQGKRDPFVSPIQERKLAVCTVGGKRCLFVGDINLIGIVESSNGVVAVVANGRHTYFLRENDPLADGEVERITSDTITLRQRTSDLMGKPVVREVTRRIGMPAV